jgi:hypothetical protein
MKNIKNFFEHKFEDGDNPSLDPDMGNFMEFGESDIPQKSVNLSGQAQKLKGTLERTLQREKVLDWKVEAISEDCIRVKLFMKIQDRFSNLVRTNDLVKRLTNNPVIKTSEIELGNRWSDKLNNIAGTIILDLYTKENEPVFYANPDDKFIF